MAEPQFTPPTPYLRAFDHVALLDHEVVPGRPGVPGAGAPLLLLHGLEDDRDRLRFLSDALCGEGRIALLPTLRDHHPSPAPVWGYSPLDYAADVHRLTDVLPSPAHVIGYSYGALVGLVYAAVMGPGRVRSLVLLDQSLERRPHRIEGGPWAESSFLKWEYDYTHLLDMVTAAGIPVLMVVPRDSHVLPEAERAALLARRHPLFSCVLMDGAHADVVRPDGPVTSVIEEFYAQYCPAPLEEER
ncbi:alpha/beta fold hydrolase [Streptomyces sp. G44]|uniref:alpha/beta fold hydrolase n=1 Tax=Streptomyces sp. G44 TaxID=2807632 RepID=UPI0019601310|nr:alpha/beta fold hydrolase [Streptomyces sp. G44]MBM7167720.1 alpha/beta fold hydrolase [Streptomyces sp. G44]